MLNSCAILSGLSALRFRHDLIRVRKTKFSICLSVGDELWHVPLSRFPEILPTTHATTTTHVTICWPLPCAALLHFCSMVLWHSSVNCTTQCRTAALPHCMLCCCGPPTCLGCWESGSLDDSKPWVCLCSWVRSTNDATASFGIPPIQRSCKIPNAFVHYF